MRARVVLAIHSSYALVVRSTSDAQAARHQLPLEQQGGRRARVVVGRVVVVVIVPISHTLHTESIHRIDWFLYHPFLPPHKQIDSQITDHN